MPSHKKKKLTVDGYTTLAVHDNREREVMFAKPIFIWLS